MEPLNNYFEEEDLGKQIEEAVRDVLPGLRIKVKVVRGA